MNLTIKLISLVILCLMFIASSCNNNIVTNNQSSNYEIPAWDYADNCYIPDTLYKKSFYDYNHVTVINGQITSFEDSNRILVNNPDFGIWLQCNETDSSKRLAEGITQLYAEPVSGYPDSLKIPDQIPGLKFFGYYKKLNSGEYYINPLSGLIIFKINVPDNYHCGITYTVNSGYKYGKGDFGSGIEDTLIFKMFKVSNCSPDATPLAWELKLKNIYKLPTNNFTQSDFTFSVYHYNNNKLDSNIYIYGIPASLNTLLEIDRFTGNSKYPPPDGIFDYIPDFTVLPDLGYIIFPTQKPFMDCIVHSGADSAQYSFSEIYTNRKTVVQTLLKANLYFLAGYLKKN
jgi:hypothetical protein